MSGLKKNVAAPGANTKRSRFPLWLKLLIVFCAPFAMILIIMLLPSRFLPDLMQPEVIAAQSKWKKQNLNSYDMEASFYNEGKTSLISAKIRNGNVIEVIRDKVPILNPEELRAWSVDGQFTMILDHIQQRDKRTFPVPTDTKVTLRGRFDEQLGYPSFYAVEAVGTPHNYKYEILKVTPVKE